VQERFRKAASVLVMIVEGNKEFLICGQVSFGAPLQMASKQVQSVAVFNFLRHASQVDPLQTDSTENSC
jgi:hypothetical protein